MDAAEALPPLPLGWRDEAVSMLFEFLEDAGLASTLDALEKDCLLYTSPSPRDGLLSRMPSSA